MHHSTIPSIHIDTELETNSSIAPHAKLLRDKGFLYEMNRINLLRMGNVNLNEVNYV